MTIQTLFTTEYNGVQISIEVLGVEKLPQGTEVLGFSINNRGGLISANVIGLVMVALKTGCFDVLKNSNSNLSAFRNDLVRENAINEQEYIASGGDAETYKFLTQ